MAACDSPEHRQFDFWLGDWDVITWTSNEDGTVRQHWRASKDGKTWQDVFDGIYSRRK